MQELAGLITKENLLKAVRDAGCEVTQDQLNRWQRKGLLPGLQWDHLGRDGSQTLYPEKLIKQLFEICRIRKNERRLLYIGWRLWWDGYEVDSKLIRSFLQRPIKEWNAFISYLTCLDDEVVQRKIAASAKGRFKNKSVRRARKRISSQKFPQLVMTIMAVISGQYAKENWEAEADQFDFAKALGIKQASQQEFRIIHPWKSGESLNHASAFFRQLSFATVLSDASDEDIIQGRNQLQTVLQVIKFGSEIDKKNGKTAFGFSAIDNSLNDIKPLDQAILLIFWLAARKDQKIGEAAQNLVEENRGVANSILREKGLELMSVELPSIANLISAERRQASTCSEETQKVYKDELEKFYQENQKDVEDFWSRHPEYRGIET